MRRPKPDGPHSWHVMSRGTRRLPLFYEEKDYRIFLTFLKRALKATGCVLMAFALMLNHYHLILHGTSAALSRCMRRVNYWYSRYHNRKRGLGGHTYEGPYKAYLQPSPLLLLQRIAYVFLNPVTAGLATRLEDYPWSGYRSFVGLDGSPLEVDSSMALAKLSPDPSKARAEFSKILDLTARLTTRRKKASKVPTARQIWSDEFRWLLEFVRGMDRDFGPMDRTLVALHWGNTAGIPPRIMAKVLGEPDSERVRTALSRLRKRLRQDPDLASRLASP